MRCYTHIDTPRPKKYKDPKPVLQKFGHVFTDIQTLIIQTSKYIFRHVVKFHTHSDTLITDIISLNKSYRTYSIRNLFSGTQTHANMQTHIPDIQTCFYSHADTFPNIQKRFILIFEQSYRHIIIHLFVFDNNKYNSFWAIIGDFNERNPSI